ncbi:hypothetical protein BU15DRAFT_78683 [Melanogaster broomeanus]|nr:hypothetical protein BU15DRAFT_78683 [Melanogaster broomeanus]
MSAEDSVGTFWSEVLKDRHRTTARPIPCIDGRAEYAQIPDVVTIRPKLLRCTFQDLPRDYPYGFYTFTPGLNLIPTLPVWIPYIEMHCPPDTAVPCDELGHAGDTFVVEIARRPPFWVKGRKSWLSVNENFISEHPFTSSSSLVEAVTIHPHPPFGNPGGATIVREERGRNSIDKHEGSPPDSTPIAGSLSQNSIPSASVTSVSRTVPPSPSSVPPRLSLKRTSRPASEVSVAERDPKRARRISDDEECRAQPIRKQRSTSMSAPGAQLGSSSIPTEARSVGATPAPGPDAPIRTPIPAPSSDVDSLQLLIQQQGEGLTRQNEELVILRKRNAELCSENVTITQERKVVEDELESLKEEGKQREKVVVELQTNLAETRAKLDLTTQKIREGSEVAQALRFKLRASELEQQKSLHTISVYQDNHRRFRETIAWQAQQLARSRDDSQSMKDSLTRREALQATLRGDKERLQGELEDSVVIVEGLQRELAEERASHARVQDEVQRLEVEVKALLVQPKPVETQLDVRHLQSLPPELRATVAPFLGAICGTFSKMQDNVDAEKERADSANEMYANERDAHAESKRISDQQVDELTLERDTALQTSRSFQRELSEIREALGKLSQI